MAAAVATTAAVASMVLAAAPHASADTGSTNQTGYQAASVTNGTLQVTGCTWPADSSSGGCQSHNLGVPVAPGTSPSIAAMPASSSAALPPISSHVAWQGVNNHLWITGPAGPVDTGLAMMPGTSPGLAELPAGNQFQPAGGDVAVFQGSDGHPWWYSPVQSGRMSSSLFMAPGTSPAIALAPTDAGGWQAVWQGANNHLWSTSPVGPRDLGWRMMPATSPSLAGLTNGEFAAVIQAYNGTLLVTVGAESNPASAATTSPGPYNDWGSMAPGASPAITSTPPTSDTNPGDLWEAAFHGIDGRLWGNGALIAGPVTIPRTPGGFMMAPGSSPAVNGIILPSYLGAGATPGYEMFYPDASGNLRDVIGSAFSPKYLDPASPEGSIISAGTSPSADSFQ